MQRLGFLWAQVKLENASDLPFVIADGYLPELFLFACRRSSVFYVGIDVRPGSRQVVGRPFRESAALCQVDVLVFLYRYLLVSREVL